MFKVEKNALTSEIYFSLREKVKFQEYAPEDVAAALKKTLFSVVVFHGETPVGIARMVGDDRIVFFIKDVVVDPDYQGNDIGRLLMQSLLEYAREHGCPHAYVGLMATPQTECFYEKFGFIRRPAPGLGHGMVLFVNEEPQNL